AATTDRNLGGFLTGVDAALGGGWRAGVTVWYVQTNLSVDARRSNADVDSYVLGAYAGGKLGHGFALRSGATWAWSDIETSRAVAFPGFFEREKADYDGNNGQVFAEIAYPILSHGALLEPFAGLAYVHASTDSFTEDGALAGLSSRGMNMDLGYGTIGARLGATWTWSQTLFKPHASIAWQYAFGDTTPEHALAFASTGIGMNIQGVPIADNSALVEVGADLVVGRDATLGISYVGQYSADFNDNGIRGRFNWKF
ncbi:MAG: autotransporter outer membrane beta-barrel domain-containing protein, partial [Hyphomicrobiaceae bacterium]